MPTEISVLIADDHPIFRRGLREVVAAEPDLTLMADVEDGESAWQLIHTHRPSVAVLDLDMPQRDGLDVARAVRASGVGVAVVLLTMHRSEQFFHAALDLGVEGYVLKDSAVTEIVTAIRAVAAGRHYVTPLLTDYLLKRANARATGQPGLASLTDAERRVLVLLADYKTSKEIANELFISVRTVDRHRANIMLKLELKGVHALLQFAIEHKGEL
jgi:DNA-binding NarL/FixJ family response regulator